MERKDPWKEDYSHIGFIIKAVYDVLLSPSNLVKWGKREVANCPLCNGSGSLQHVLSSCPKGLPDGRFRWRHDKVLEEIAEIFENSIKINKYEPARKNILFVKEGEKEKP